MSNNKLLHAIGLCFFLNFSNTIADIAPETISIEKLEPAHPHRIYLTDLALGHVIDGRIHILNGDNFKYLGLIGTGLMGLTALSSDSSEMLNATAYYSKGTRGEKTEFLEAYSTEDLTLKAEIPIPPRHAQALPYVGTIMPSADDHFVYIQNATPASSISIVDRKNERFASEVTTPGCWIILPSASNMARFSTMCGDGTFLTITHDQKGEVVKQSRSEKLFNADDDPLFVQAARIGDLFYFVSYLGIIHEINVGGETSVLKKSWPLGSVKDLEGGWRPGGYQLIAVDKTSRRLYVAMHSGGKEGSHKYPGEEIWAVDLKTKKVIQRIAGANSIAMTLTKERKPYLYLYDGVEAKIHKYETIPQMKAISVSEPVGEFAGLIQTH